MRSLLKEMKAYRREAVLAPSFKMLEALFDLFVPLVMQRIIDRGIPAGDRGEVVRMCLLLLLLALVGLSCAVSAQYFSARAAVGFATRLRHMLFSHIQTLDFAEQDRMGVSALLTRMTSDINQIQNGVNLTLRLFLRSPFIVFGAMIMAFTVDVKAALIFAVVIPLLSLVVFGVMLITSPMYRRVQGGLDRVTRRTRENLTGVRVIRAFRLETEEEEAFVSENAALKGLQVAAGRISAFLNPVTYVLINLAVVILIYSGALRVSAGALTQGAVVALVNYMNQILVELIKLANLIVNMTKAAACGNRVAEVLRGGSEREAECLAEPAGGSAVRQETPLPDEVLSFEHVSMRYGDVTAEVLSDISFSVRRGQTFGIIGGTGSGKSSLVSLISGFYRADRGTVRVDGEDVSLMPLPLLRKKVGIALQKSVLFRGTVRDNLLWGKPDAEDSELKDALRTAQALDFILEREGGLDAEVEQEGRNFSGGQKQRLSVARALLKRPELLILDDSSSALDFATDAALREAIARRDPGMTVLIVSQRASSVMAADRILVLDDGRAVGLGTHRELMESCPVYREIVEVSLS